MSNIEFEKTIIYTRQILFFFADIFMSSYALSSNIGSYRILYETYNEFREKDKDRFCQEISRLKRLGYIKIYIDEKKKKVELTKKGQEKLKKYICDQIIIDTDKKWDKKWRIVVFDIPEKKKVIRNILREKLLRLGFIELQESIYVYPFDCLEEINFFRGVYYIRPYVQFILADRIETEKDLIADFFDIGVFNGINYQ